MKFAVGSAERAIMRLASEQMALKYVLDRQHYLLYDVPNSTWGERFLGADEVPAGTAFGVVADGFATQSVLMRVCAALRGAAGCSVRLVQLAAVVRRAPELPSAAAGTLVPDAGAELLKASDLSPWVTQLMGHLFLPTPPKRRMVLSGPCGCGKTLALERARVLAVKRQVPHLWLSAAEDGDDKTDLLAEVHHFLVSRGAHADALLVVDDVDAFASMRRSQKLMALVLAARCRCVLVCNNAYGPHVRALQRDKAHYVTVRATAVTDAALEAHIQAHFPQLSAEQRAGLVAESRGDVRVAQLRAELEVRGGTKVRGASAVDDQRQGALHYDLLRAVQAGEKEAAERERRYPGERDAIRREQSRAVVAQCAQLLRARAVDAGTVMQHNYARLCGKEDLDALADMADDVSGAVHYRQSVTDHEMADKFARQTPDDTTHDSFKDQLLFDTSVVLPCVRLARAAARHSTALPELKFPSAALWNTVHGTAALCRAIDRRHEVLVRTTLALGAECSEEHARALASTRLSISAAHDDFLSHFTAAGAKSTGDDADEDADEEGGGGVTVAAGGVATIGELERTLFVFPLLCTGLDLRTPAGRRSAIVACAQYGFDAESYARALEIFAPQLANGASADFQSSRVLVLDRDVEATRAEVVGAPGAPVRRSVAVSAAKRKRPVKAAPPSAPTMMDGWVASIKRPQGGTV